MTRHPTLAYVIDPRFPGGTSAAVARELLALAGLARIEVHGISSGMFPGRPPAPVLMRALDDLGIDLVMDAPRISADLVVLHNPAFLKFDRTLAPRIVARELVVVCHENFLRPGGFEAFDVAHCLGLVDRASLALSKTLAPVSPHNRATVRDWLSSGRAGRSWSVLDEDWFNICDFDAVPPASAPADRRGRHSRPGLEKFPSAADLDLCFPAHAAANVILGADLIERMGLHRPHWRLVPFQGIEIHNYFKMIDFMVYFTAPTWRESFGRVLAEAVAAGKVVVSDRDTAAVFGGGVIGASPAEVDAIVARHVESPALYADRVRRGQGALAAFSAEAFRDRLAPRLDRLAQAAA